MRPLRRWVRCDCILRVAGILHAHLVRPGAPWVSFVQMLPGVRWVRSGSFCRFVRHGAPLGSSVLCGCVFSLALFVRVCPGGRSVISGTSA